MTIPGGVLGLAYVDWVAVLPTHRRKGIFTKLTKHQFNDIRDHCEAIAGLTASESSIYGRFGYGISSWAENWSIQRDHSKISDQLKVHGETRFVEAPEVQEMADAAVEEAAGHDLTMEKIQQRMEERARCWDEEGLTYEERLERIVTEEADTPADGIFPVDAQWALEWDEVEEDSETARCLRENPDEWMSRHIRDSAIHHTA